MRRSFCLFSPRLKRNSHPRNTVRWKTEPGRSVKRGFYRPMAGASKMKWQFTLPYVREVDSLHHYPAVSEVTGKAIDWYADEPQDGYEAVRIYGENTLELKGMPLGKTPEYIQERLRRFFAKFGPVQHCRAEPHPLDPYQCEGTAYVTFRDRPTALKALKAPLKFPASLHDKVISMKHLDTDKTNDPNYLEKAKFWDKQLISIARQLHIQLLTLPEMQGGKPILQVDRDLWEHEMVELPPVEFDDPHSAEAMALKAPWGRGGVPLPKKLYGMPTRVVPAQESVLKRFGNWAEFLTVAPLDELFSLERKSSGAQSESRSSNQDEGEGDAAGEADDAAQPSSSSSAVSSDAMDAMPESGAAIVVRGRLVSSTQRARILTRARVALAQRLHEEFSVWWREGKVPLPVYTQRRVEWWDHKPPLPFELQIMSRSMHRVRMFDEKFLYQRRIVRARQERRKAKAAEWTEERKKLLEEKQKTKEERRQRALEAVQGARCGGLLGNLGYLLPSEKRRSLT